MDSSARLLQRFHAGDHSLLGTILELHRDWLWGYVRRQMGEHLRAFETSEDIVQDVLRQILERGPAFLPVDEGQFRRLIGAMVLNRLRDRNDYARAACRDRALEVSGGEISRIGSPIDSITTPSSAAARTEEQNLLLMALDLIAPADAHIVRRRRWDQASFEEIAEELDMNPAAVQKRSVRVIARLGLLMRKLERGDLSDLPKVD